MSSHRFYHQIGSVTNYSKYFNVVINLLKNIYNASGTPDLQKQVIKEDKNIKYLIMKVLHKNGIFTVEENKKLQFSETRIEQAMNDFQIHPETYMIELIIGVVNTLVDSDLRIA
mmetsp:Transcript_10944/g.9674  ORF Transcript_10944/g.9674 Transcript_10944/m.9674 type:complete len:114 (+) Transcript_10944:1212-1553(+)